MYEIQRIKVFELENTTLSTLIESLFQLDCYTPLYKKDTKQKQNRSMETTGEHLMNAQGELVVLGAGVGNH